MTGLHSQLADDQASLYLGPDKNLNLNVAATQLSWVERGVTFGLLSGEHELTALNRAELSWDASIARAFRNQPDRRDTVFNYNASRDFWSYVDGSESGRHFFANQAEDSYGGKLDWLQPIVRGKKTDVSAKLGGLINVKERAFSARRFAYRTRPPTSQEDLIRLTCQTETFDLSCPDQVLDGANLDRFYMQEGTLDGDFYDAHLKVYAGYAMLDLDFSKRLRVAVGPRIEATDQSIRPRDFGGNALPDKSAQLDAVNLLPAVSAIFSATEQLKTRASYSRTLARPQLRELAPFAFADFWGGYLQTGFPDLELTQIDNFDTRLEFYPSLTEILAASVFYKSFTNPIEILLIPSGTTTTLSYRNAPSANVIGLELEARKNLGFIAEALGPFSIITNLTLSRSRTDLPPSTFLTSRSRPLINQAPWVYNLTLDYTSDFGLEARLAYNINGLTLKEVGTQGVPDTYAHPRHVLDLTISQKFLEHWIAELQVENITNDDVLWTQGAEVDPEDIQLQYTRGTTFSLQIGYEL